MNDMSIVFYHSMTYRIGMVDRCSGYAGSRDRDLLRLVKHSRGFTANSWCVAIAIYLHQNWKPLRWHALQRGLRDED